MTETAKKKAPAKRATKKEADTLWGAVLAARNMAEPIVKDSHCSMGGGGYNYLSTETVLRECVPIMSECGLVLMPHNQTFSTAGTEKEHVVMEMTFTLQHIPSGESVTITHSLPIENMRTPTKGSLAVRTTAFQYVIRDILALPRVEERMPEVDNPEGQNQAKQKPLPKPAKKKTDRSATDEQMQYLRDRQAEAPDPVVFGETMNQRLQSRYGVTMDTLTSDIAEIIINQFESKRKEKADAMANG